MCDNLLTHISIIQKRTYFLDFKNYLTVQHFNSHKVGLKLEDNKTIGS